MINYVENRSEIPETQFGENWKTSTSEANALKAVNYRLDFIGNKAAKMASKPYAAGISSIFKVIAETLAYQAFHYFR